MAGLESIVHTATVWNWLGDKCMAGVMVHMNPCREALKGGEKYLLGLHMNKLLVLAIRETWRPSKRHGMSRVNLKVLPSRGCTSGGTRYYALSDMPNDKMQRRGGLKQTRPHLISDEAGGIVFV